MSRNKKKSTVEFIISHIIYLITWLIELASVIYKLLYPPKWSNHYNHSKNNIKKKKKNSHQLKIKGNKPTKLNVITLVISEIQEENINIIKLIEIMNWCLNSAQIKYLFIYDPKGKLFKIFQNLNNF